LTQRVPRTWISTSEGPKGRAGVNEAAYFGELGSFALLAGNQVGRQNYFPRHADYPSGSSIACLIASKVIFKSTRMA
jgi:hypothetical protein